MATAGALNVVTPPICHREESFGLGGSPKVDDAISPVEGGDCFVVPPRSDRRRVTSSHTS
jgi:hypothetical protein